MQQLRLLAFQQRHYVRFCHIFSGDTVNACVQQVAMADVLIVNKTDMVTSDQLSKVSVIYYPLIALKKASRSRNHE